MWTAHRLRSYEEAAFEAVGAAFAVVDVDVDVDVVDLPLVLDLPEPDLPDLADARESVR